MRENRDFVLPINTLNIPAQTPFSWVAQHTALCLDHFLVDKQQQKSVQQAALLRGSSSLMLAVILSGINF